MVISERTSGAAVVLLSGGMDSATCLAMASRAHPRVYGLTVDYGQRHRREVAAARSLARHFRVAEHRSVTVPLRRLVRSALIDRSIPLPMGRAFRTSLRIPRTYVPARNTLLLALALGYAESRGCATIYLGANAVDYSGYPDCRPAYFRAFARLAQLATKRGVERTLAFRIRTPLLRLSKPQIVRLGNRLGVPWELTWSCYAGGSRPCERCDACRLRRLGFNRAGIEDPLARRGASRARRRT